MRKAAEIVMGVQSLQGVRVAIQGAGNVGVRLAKLITEDGGKILISDIDAVRAKTVADSVGGETLDAREILTADTEIFAPCALGGILNVQTVEKLNAKVICGGANNQLADASVADLLTKKNIFYCPDYLVNAGGIIDLHYQLNGPEEGSLAEHLNTLPLTLVRIHDLAQEECVSMATAAGKIVERRITRAASSLSKNDSPY